MVQEIVSVFTTVFTSYVSPLATAAVDAFKALFVESGTEGAAG